jgi:glutathione S-transferase
MSLNQPILHHYPTSPYAEKIRLALGLKGLAWHSVTIPRIMPKPDLMPLTGGYRKTPVLQIGADIYCDTQLIMRELERRYPAPSFYTDSDAGAAGILAWSLDRTLFQPAVSVAFTIAGGALPPEFIADREKFSGRRIDVEQLKVNRQLFVDQLRPQLHWISQMLADGRPFLLGAKPALPDFSAYHPVWFMRNLMGPGFAALPGVAALQPWYDRMTALGHGQPADLASTAALDIARDAEPAEPPAWDEDTASGRKPGDRISVTPDDTGRDPVTGDLVSLAADQIVLARETPELGRLHVHFPRAGFVITAASA